jgi:hypothetical protein
MTGVRSQTSVKLSVEVPRQQRSRSLGSYLAAEGSAAKFTDVSGWQLSDSGIFDGDTQNRPKIGRRQEYRCDKDRDYRV